MLTASPSPRLNPGSESTSPGDGYASPWAQTTTAPRARGSTKSASPIVRPRSAYTSTRSATIRSPFQYPRTDSKSLQLPASPSASVSVCSRGTQTSPISQAINENATTTVLMIDASTQYSPPGALKSHKAVVASSSQPLSASVTSQLDQAPTAPSAAKPKPVVFDPVAYAAVRGAASSGKVATSLSQSKAEQESCKEKDEVTHGTVSAKRNHSVIEATQALSLQVEATKKMRPEPRDVKTMPSNYSFASTRDLVLLISSMLVELIQYNDSIPSLNTKLTRFHSRAPPGISVVDYLQRLTTHATLSAPILLSMVFYIDKLCASYPEFAISSLTVHRFLISAATVASKALSDTFWTNKIYAKVGGVSIQELALLELELLTRLQWRTLPQPEVLVDYYRSLVQRSPEYVLEGHDNPEHTVPPRQNREPG